MANQSVQNYLRCSTYQHMPRPDCSTMHPKCLCTVLATVLNEPMVHMIQACHFGSLCGWVSCLLWTTRGTDGMFQPLKNATDTAEKSFICTGRYQRVKTEPYKKARHAGDLTVPGGALWTGRYHHHNICITDKIVFVPQPTTVTYLNSFFFLFFFPTISSYFIFILNHAELLLFLWRSHPGFIISWDTVERMVIQLAFFRLL